MPSRHPAHRPFLSTLRALAECFQAFEALSSRHVRELGLTPAQFDVIATLGNTDGFSFRELGARTLITKGTLTGVVERLQAAGLVRRLPSPDDRRSNIVVLTAAGNRTFEQVFPAHVAHLGRAFDALSEAQSESLRGGLRLLRDQLRQASSDYAAETVSADSTGRKAA